MKALDQMKVLGNKALSRLAKFIFVDTAGHKHNFQIAETITRAPTMDGGVTTYSIMVCTRELGRESCPEARIFGEENYKLTTDEHKDWLQEELAKQGFRLSPD